MEKDVSYHSEYSKNIDYSGYDFPVKTFAYYLPQFHRIKENDEWWGEGFTEWTNTRKARPFYPGHYEPREPHPDFGYYDLTDVETIKKQARLARQHGITASRYTTIGSPGRGCSKNRWTSSTNTRRLT